MTRRSTLAPSGRPAGLLRRLARALSSRAEPPGAARSRAKPVKYGESAALDQPLSGADWLWTLGSLCQLHKLPFSRELALKGFAPPYSTADLIDAARRLGFKVKPRAARARPSDLHGLPLPCLAWLAAVDGPGTGSGEEIVRPVLLLRADGDTLLAVEAGAQQPAVMSAAVFDSRARGGLVLFAPE